MATLLRARTHQTRTEFPTVLEELHAMADAGFVSLHVDLKGDVRVAVGRHTTQAAPEPSLVERMQELHAAGAEDLYA